MLTHKNDRKAWLYLLVPLILMTIFTFYPVINTLLIAFNNFDSSTMVQNPFIDEFFTNGFGSRWGFFNFRQIFAPHSTLRYNLVNTLILVFISVPLSVTVSLLIAVGINSIKPFKKFFQIVFFLPYVTNSLAIGMVFAIIFRSGTGGLINSIFGLDQFWLAPPSIVFGSPHWWRAILALQIYTLWDSLAFRILVFIGALQNVSKQYYDAAKIDSTPRWRVLRRITIPLISPVILFIFITSFIGAFRTYDSIVGLFGDNWGQTAHITTIVGFIYRQIEIGISEPSAYAYGAAAAVVLLVIIMFFTFINLTLSKRLVHY